MDRFCATYEAKYPKAADCLARDRQTLLAFYDFPAAHWQYRRTTNPIESTFATIRLRTAKTWNCLSVKTALSLIHQLAMSAQKRWRRLRGSVSSLTSSPDSGSSMALMKGRSAGKPPDSGRPYTRIDGSSVNDVIHHGPHAFEPLRE